jgi:hypothetical protein
MTGDSVTLTALTDFYPVNGHPARDNWESRMTIREIVGQAFYYARTCRSLWLFGFVVGIASGGSNGGGNTGGDGSAGSAAGLATVLSLFATEAAVAAVVILLVVALAGVVLRFLSEGALIEGVVRARRGGAMTTGEGFRAGWAHWGVLLRIGLLYVAALIVSVAALAAPGLLAWWAFGPIGAAVAGLPAVVVAVPWLVTLSLLQAFAMRIAVLEDRRAVDAIRKARLFLHGRLVHGLKLMVATFIGSLAITLLTVLVIGPVVLLLVALATVLPVPPLIAIGLLVLVPALCVLTAMLGIYRSSVWTLGYVTQVES